MVVAGEAQDKNVTNQIVEWKEVGVNLNTPGASVEQIRLGVSKVLDDGKYKHNVLAMSKKFERYDLGKVFDEVIQGELRKFMKEKKARNGHRTHEFQGCEGEI
jgi:UDP:flavonoid glycosyltransferase YjiC (YdhE family)